MQLAVVFLHCKYFSKYTNKQTGQKRNRWVSATDKNIFFLKGGKQQAKRRRKEYTKRRRKEYKIYATCLQWCSEAYHGVSKVHHLEHLDLEHSVKGPIRTMVYFLVPHAS